jgi:hypothetical protein
MTRPARTAGVVAILAATASFLFSLYDLSRVPFHPDQSSWIFMSHDFDRALDDFGRLRWRRGASVTGAARLRLLDAPMPKYVIGFGRALRGYRNVPSFDWDWTESWEQNVGEGALPDGRLLLTARIAAATMFALSIGVFVLVAVDVAGFLTTAIATVLLVFHPFEQLHLRRAMAESTLQLFTLIFIVSVLYAVASARRAVSLKRQCFAALAVGVTLGVAVASKHSGAALAPVAVAGAICAGWDSARLLRERVFAATVLSGVAAASALVTFVALNPVLYDQPLRAGYNMVTGRRTMAANQATYTETVKPEMVLQGVYSRLRAAYREVFWDSPAFSEFAEYDDKIASDTERYNQRWTVTVMTNGYWKLSLLLFAVVGLLRSVYAVARDRLGSNTRPLQILLVWIAANLVFIASLVPLDWQRYFLPLLPPVLILAGYGLALMLERFTKLSEVR